MTIFTVYLWMKGRRRGKEFRKENGGLVCPLLFVWFEFGGRVGPVSQNENRDLV